MDFSLTQVYVLSSSNTLPTTGSTQNLAAGQVGVYLPDWTAATTSNIGSASYIVVAQGRNVAVPGLGTIKSDKIYPANIIEFYKVTAEPIANVQITSATNFSFECDQDITVTLRLFSNYINAGFFNGLTRSVTVKTPCCNCGANPCATVTQDGVVAELAAAINAEPMLSKYVIASVSGTGSSATLTITGQALNIYGNACDLTAFPNEYDRMDFYTFIYAGPETSQDYQIYDRCDVPGTVSVLQRATYPIGSSNEIAQIEKNYYSYTTTQKHIFSSPLYNNAFQSNVVPGTFYDTYVLKFKSPDLTTWGMVMAQDETIILCAPTGTSAASNLATLLTDFAGTPTDYSQTLLTTTTTTSTTSTTTTTTTTLFP